MKPKSDNDKFFFFLTNKIVLSKKNDTNSLVEGEKWEKRHRGGNLFFFFLEGKSPPVGVFVPHCACLVALQTRDSSG